MVEKTTLKKVLEAQKRAVNRYNRQRTILDWFLDKKSAYVTKGDYLSGSTKVTTIYYSGHSKKEKEIIVSPDGKISRVSVYYASKLTDCLNEIYKEAGNLRAIKDTPNGKFYPGILRGAYSAIKQWEEDFGRPLSFLEEKEKRKEQLKLKKVKQK